jgi:hypothetical protein
LPRQTTPRQPGKCFEHGADKGGRKAHTLGEPKRFRFWVVFGGAHCRDDEVRAVAAGRVESLGPYPGGPLPKLLIVGHGCGHQEDGHEMIADADEHRTVGIVTWCDWAVVPPQAGMTNA